MKIKFITSYKPGTWESFAKRGIHSMAEQFPDNIDIVLYCEEPQPKDVHSRITCVDLTKAEPNLFAFKNKYQKRSEKGLLRPSADPDVPIDASCQTPLKS